MGFAAKYLNLLVTVRIRLHSFNSIHSEAPNKVISPIQCIEGKMKLWKVSRLLNHSHNIPSTKNNNNIAGIIPFLNFPKQNISGAVNLRVNFWSLKDMKRMMITFDDGSPRWLMTMIDKKR